MNLNSQGKLLWYDDDGNLFDRSVTFIGVWLLLLFFAFSMRRGFVRPCWLIQGHVDKKRQQAKNGEKKLIQTIGIQFYALVVLESEKLKYHFRKLESKITVMLICFCSSSNFSIHEKTVCSSLSISRNGMESFRSQLKGFLDLVWFFISFFVTLQSTIIYHCSF